VWVVLAIRNVENTKEEERIQMRKTSPTKDSFTARFLSSDASSSFHFVFLLFRGEDM